MDEERFSKLGDGDPGALQAHPFANMFPMLPDDQLADLSASIKRDGLLEPIVICAGLILDGRNRHAAIRLSGLPWDPSWFVEFEGTPSEAAQYVESKNVNRRHLTVSERSMAAYDFGKLRGMKDGEIAEKFGISAGMIARARHVREKLPENVQAMVQRGEIGLGSALAATGKLDRRQLAQFKSAGALKEQLIKAGAIGNHYVAWTAFRLIHALTDVLGVLADRDGAELKQFQIEIDTATQQLIVLGQRAADAAAGDEAAVA